MGNRLARPVRSPPLALPQATLRTPQVDIAQDANNASGKCSAPHDARDLLDGRERLDRLWINVNVNDVDVKDGFNKLIRGGFFHQGSSGIYHVLPLGLRLQNKISNLVDRHMRGLGASRVQMSALSHESVWRQSGRLDKIGSELFRLTDRKGHPYLLSPTHEEEVTKTVSRHLRFKDQLPLRVYQITPKYRDELRSRQGLLRTREFLMKDLYTFDNDVESALKTYEQVRAAYARIFIDELKLPMLIAQASSGDMGGDLSHEYHLPTDLGEDHVMSCDRCDYVANEEVVETRRSTTASDPDQPENQVVNVWRGVSKDRTTIVNVWYVTRSVSKSKTIVTAPKEAINTHAVKKVFPDLDSGFGDPSDLWARSQKTASMSFNVVNLFDVTVSKDKRHRILASKDILPKELASSSSNSSTGHFISGEVKDMTDDNHANSYLRILQGDHCPRCSHGSLKVTKAIELGHTFHLGTRYSEPMGAIVKDPPWSRDQSLIAGQSKDKNAKSTTMTTATGTATPASNNTKTTVRPKKTSHAMQMGCHGIGISRIIGAVAQHVASKYGLDWPRAIVPYEVVLASKRLDKHPLSDENAVLRSLYDQAVSKNLDVVLDDQPGGIMSQRYSSYALVGIPVWVILGKSWVLEKKAEVVCKRLKFNEEVPAEEIWGCVKVLLDKL